MSHQIENININKTEYQSRCRNKRNKKTLELESITEMENLAYGFNSRFEQAEQGLQKHRKREAEEQGT